MTENTTSFSQDMPQAAFLTVKEAALHLRLCDKQIRRLIARHELPAYRFGTALRIKTRDLNAFVDSRQISPIQSNAKGR
jgi:excisionase family DNA binding protein